MKINGRRLERRDVDLKFEISDVKKEPARCRRYSGQDWSQRRRPEASGYEGPGNATVRGWRAVAVGRVRARHAVPLLRKRQGRKERCRGGRQELVSEAWRCVGTGRNACATERLAGGGG